MQSSPKSPTAGGFPKVETTDDAAVAGSVAVPSVDAPDAGKLPSSAAEMSATGDAAAEIPGVSVSAPSVDTEVAGAIPAAGDVSVGESPPRLWRASYGVFVCV